MDILDQSEVDALLSSAAPAGGDAGASPGSALGAAAGLVDTPRPPPPVVNLPAELKLVVNESALQRIDPVQVPVIVQLAERSMPLDQILKFVVGTIVEFEKPADAELDLVVNNISVGTGNAVKCGERFGLRVISIRPWAQRVIEAGLYR